MLKIVGDAIPQPLTGVAGNAELGREVSLSRERGNCSVCHILFAGEEAQGNVGPDLRGVAARLSPGQIRLRLVDGLRLNPRSVMPSYFRVDGLTRVAVAYLGKPILSAQEIEDVIAFLMTLGEDNKR